MGRRDGKRRTTPVSARDGFSMNPLQASASPQNPGLPGGDQGVIDGQPDYLEYRTRGGKE